MFGSEFVDHCQVVLPMPCVKVISLVSDNLWLGYLLAVVNNLASMGQYDTGLEDFEYITQCAYAF